MLVSWRVYEQPRRSEQGSLDSTWYGEQEEDLDVGRNGQCCDDGF
jgi:hypothetical protein